MNGTKPYVHYDSGHGYSFTNDKSTHDPNHAGLLSSVSFAHKPDYWKAQEIFRNAQVIAIVRWLHIEGKECFLRHDTFEKEVMWGVVDCVIRSTGITSDGVYCLKDSRFSTFVSPDGLEAGLRTDKSLFDAMLVIERKLRYEFQLDDEDVPSAIVWQWVRDALDKLNFASWEIAHG